MSSLGRFIITSGMVSGKSYQVLRIFFEGNQSRNMPNMKKPNHHENLIRTDITVLSLLDPETQAERVLSARCVQRCNISHRKSFSVKSFLC